jgi:hypothetical protein
MSQPELLLGLPWKRLGLPRFRQIRKNWDESSAFKELITSVTSLSFVNRQQLVSCSRNVFPLMVCQMLLYLFILRRVIWALNREPSREPIPRIGSLVACYSKMSWDFSKYIQFCDLRHWFLIFKSAFLMFRNGVLTTHKVIKNINYINHYAVEQTKAGGGVSRHCEEVELRKHQRTI